MMHLVNPVLNLLLETSPILLILAGMTISSGLLYLWTRWTDFLIVFCSSALYALPFMFR